MNGTNGNQLLGKYAVPIAAVVTIGVIVLALLQHFLVVLGFTTENDSFIDSIAMVAFGIVLGGAGSLVTLNGTVKKADAASRGVVTLASVTPGVSVDSHGAVVKDAT